MAAPRTTSLPAGPPDDPDRLTPWQRFYRRYSSHGELPRSSLASLAVHLLLAFVVILMSGALMPKDRTPPGVDVVRVGEGDMAAPGDGDGSPEAGEQALEETDATETAESDATSMDPVESVETEIEQQPREETEGVTTEELLAASQQDAQRTAAASKRAKAALQRAKEKVQRNLGGSGTGGGGGSGPTGRQARQARWVLRFPSGHPDPYFRALEGLGAKLAFMAEGDRARYFSNLTSGSPTSEVRDMSGDDRMTWFSEDAQFARLIAKTLGVPPAEFFLVFLPREVEDRMAKLEADHAGLPEDRIASTTFVVVQRGGSYDVQVLDQTPK